MIVAGILFSIFVFGVAVHEYCCADNAWLNELFFAVFSVGGCILVFSIFYPFYMILKSFWIKPPIPQGEILTRRNNPEIFQLLERLRRQFSGPKIHEVRLNDNDPLSIIRVFPFGIFGWSRNFLMLGAPLLSVLTPEEFEAGITHEYCRIVGRYGGKFVLWLQRVRHILEEIQPNDKFIAYHLALSRIQIYEADRLVGELLGIDAVVKLITLSTIENKMIERYRNSVHTLSKTVLNSHSNIQQIRNTFKRFYIRNEIRWSAEPDPASTKDPNPSMQDRLFAFKEKPNFDHTLFQSAFEKYLGDYDI
ncbi:M48 family metallopeptidase [Leptospira sp. WS92.C1]